MKWVTLAISLQCVVFSPRTSCFHLISQSLSEDGVCSVIWEMAVLTFDLSGCYGFIHSTSLFRKYIINYWMDFYEILSRHSWSPVDNSYWCWWSPCFSSSATMWLTFMFLGGMSWQVLDRFSMELGTEIHVPLWMTWNNFDGPQTFHLAPSSS